MLRLAADRAGSTIPATERVRSIEIPRRSSATTAPVCRTRRRARRTAAAPSKGAVAPAVRTPVLQAAPTVRRRGTRRAPRAAAPRARRSAAAIAVPAPRHARRAAPAQVAVLSARRRRPEAPAAVSAAEAREAGEDADENPTRRARDGPCLEHRRRRRAARQALLLARRRRRRARRCGARA